MYIIPAINEFWDEHQQQLWNEKAGKEIILSGDGRNDSPGHNAQYCTYTLADTDDRAIVQINVVDVREAAGKSNNMERIGFERGMEIAALMSQYLECYLRNRSSDINTTSCFVII